MYKKCMHGCCQTTVVKTPSRPPDSPLETSPQLFQSCPPIKTDHHSDYWGGKNKKQKSSLPLSATLIWQYPEMSSAATQLNPITTGGWKSKAREISSFYACHISTATVTWYIDLAVEWRSTISSARAAVILQTVGGGEERLSVLFGCLFPKFMLTVHISLFHQHAVCSLNGPAAPHSSP